MVHISLRKQIIEIVDKFLPYISNDQQRQVERIEFANEMYRLMEQSVLFEKYKFGSDGK